MLQRTLRWRGERSGRTAYAHEYVRFRLRGHDPNVRVIDWPQRVMASRPPRLPCDAAPLVAAAHEHAYPAKQVAAPARLCPLCDATTELAFCPTDRMATLLVHTFTLRPPLPEPGAIIAGRYEVTCPIGQGGHSAVFSARHLGTGQDVALKIMQPPQDSDETVAVKRFFLEARVTSALKHPNTVRVFDFGQDDSGSVFLALELLSGRTLKRAIKERKIER